MIEVITKDNLLYKRKEVWFYNNEPLDDADNTLFYHSLVVPASKTVSFSPINSLIINLKQNESKIFSEIKANYRNEIRRAEAEGVQFQVEVDPSHIELKNYLKSYKAFEKSKDLGGRIDAKRIVAFLLNKNFIITKTSLNKTDISYHSYLVEAGKTAILFYSHHNPLALDNTLRGYANKLHHWCDIKFFQQNLFEHYDFGGIDFNTTPGIAKFKCGFGGTVVTRYNFQKRKGLYAALKKQKELSKIC